MTQRCPITATKLIAMNQQITVKAVIFFTSCSGAWAARLWLFDSLENSRTNRTADGPAMTAC
ncbi:MAG: hypothetical protein ACK51R_16995 [Hyphomonadaceae bacterium]